MCHQIAHRGLFAAELPRSRRADAGARAPPQAEVGVGRERSARERDSALGTRSNTGAARYAPFASEQRLRQKRPAFRVVAPQA